MAIFAAIISAAFVFDLYFDNSSELGSNETEQEENQVPANSVYLIAQTNSISAKSSVSKTQVRKIQVKSHDRFIQKYHQLRNYQVLKAEVETQTTPLITSYHYLVFLRHLYNVPEKEDPLIS